MSKQPKNTNISKQLPNYVHKINVKSRFIGEKPKVVEISPLNNKFIVYSSEKQKNKGNIKQYNLNQVKFIYSKKQQGHCLDLGKTSGKKYQVMSSNHNQLAKDLQKGQKIQQINNFKQQHINFIPQHINYLTPIQQTLHLQQPHYLSSLHQAPQYSIVKPDHHFQDLQPKNPEYYPRRKWYINPQDWKIDTKKGSLLYINEQKKKNQTKIVKFVLKKFITTGSFMGISFPTFAMKPESILESYAKAIGAAPLLIENVKNPVERMKKFICLIHSFSILFADMEKPFNPPLGETYQATIAGGNFYAEQIVHHPPISAFFYEGKGYKLSGSMQLTANIGPNSATGLFIGDLKLHFEDGAVLKGRLPGGEFSGFVIGENKFQTYGASYAYDNKKLVCSFSTPKKNNFFQGYIGKLKPKTQRQFFNKVEQKERFQKFPFFERKSFDIVYSSMQMVYNSHVNFDEREYFNLHSQKYLPYLPEEIKNIHLLLKSDSRYRKDIPLRKQMKFEESQEEKEKLEEEERYYRKLREKYGSKKK